MTRLPRLRRDDDDDRPFLDVHLRVPRTWVYIIAAFALGNTVPDNVIADLATKVLHVLLGG